MSALESVVVSLGGSILVKEDGVDVELTEEVAELLARVARGRRVFAVVGGGPVARRYIGGARTLGADEATLDDVGIAVTRLNARLLAVAVPGAYPFPAESHDEALRASESHPVVVMGGTHAGHTTDAVAAIMAEKARAARLVIATNVDGVYDRDPRRHDDARRIPELTLGELQRIAFASGAGAGSSAVVDALAARLIARSGVPTAVLQGRDLKALEAALTGGDFHGTRVVPGEGGE